MEAIYKVREEVQWWGFNSSGPLSMDGAAHVAGDSPEAEMGSSSASSTDSASRRSRPRKGIYLRRRRRLLSARRGEGGEGDSKGTGDNVQDLALPLGCPSRRFSPSQRLNNRGRVYPAILPVDGNKVPRKVCKGITDGELDVLDTFEDEEYAREAIGISLTVDGPADARDLGSPSPFGSSLSFLPSILTMVPGTNGRTPARRSYCAAAFPQVVQVYVGAAGRCPLAPWLAGSSMTRAAKIRSNMLQLLPTTMYDSMRHGNLGSCREAGAISTSEQRQVNKRGGWSCTVTTVISIFALLNFI